MQHDKIYAVDEMKWQINVRVSIFAVQLNGNKPLN